MSLAVALCLALSAQEGLSPADSERFATVIRSASFVSDPVEALSREIERDRENPDRAALLAEWYALRGQIYVYQRMSPREALADFDEVVQYKPGDIRARYGRAECYRQLGDITRAQAEWQALGLEAGPRYAPLDPLDLVFPRLPLWTPGAGWPVFVGACVFLLICNFAVGWTQKVEVGAPLSRLILASAFLAIVEALPIVVLTAYSALGTVPVGMTEVAFGSTLLNLFCVIPYFRPPVRLRGTKVKLPRVTDEQFLARIAALAEKMRVAAPLVRLWPSTSGSQQAFAFAGTLQAPQLVVTDGILRRLSPVERDAIVAHELAHIANGSLWLLASIIPVGGAVATLMTTLAPASLAIPFGIAFLVGLRRLVSRRFEFDCDYRAARAIGFRETISALAKIHAVNPIRNTGWLSRLVFATATHPARDVRLAALARRAPPDDQADSTLDEPTIRAFHRFAVGALAIWIGVLSLTLILVMHVGPTGWLAIPLWIIALTPHALIRLAIRKHVSLTRRRMGQNWGLLSRLGVGSSLGILASALIAAVIFMSAGDWTPNHPTLAVYFLPVVTNVVMVGALVWFTATNKKRTLLRDVRIAIQVHDFRRARELCRAAPKVVRRSHLLRYNQALVEAVCGDRDVAIDALEQLWNDKPRFPLTVLLLCELLLDSNRPDRAIELAKSVGPRLPGDPAVPLLEARALRRLGRLDEAQSACDRALALAPENGSVPAAAAALALDRGETERAGELLKRASELAPGDAYALVVAAELALHGEQIEESRSAIARVREAVRTNPLVFLQVEIARLEEALAQRLHPIETENIFIE